MPRQESVQTFQEETSTAKSAVVSNADTRPGSGSHTRLIAFLVVVNLLGMIACVFASWHASLRIPSAVDANLPFDMLDFTMPGFALAPGRPATKDAGNAAAILKYLTAEKAAEQGSIRYKVPAEMEVSRPVTVTVHILGAKATPEQKETFQGTGGGALKVTPTMLVALTEPDNPDAFTITPEAGPHAGIQLVPPDGYAEWDWTVTPLKGGPVPKKLHVSAEMILNDKLPDGSPLRAEINSYDAVITVRVQPRSEIIETWLAENWDKLLKYVLPSGAVASFATYLVLGGHKKKNTGEQGREPADRKPERDDDES